LHLEEDQSLEVNMIRLKLGWVPAHRSGQRLQMRLRFVPLLGERLLQHRHDLVLAIGKQIYLTIWASNIDDVLFSGIVLLLLEVVYNVFVENTSSHFN
jgi:hypothetical protein